MSESVAEVFPLIWTDDVVNLVDWAVNALDLQESWRAPGEDGTVEHCELHWPGGKISINIKRTEFVNMGPSGIALRIDDQDRVDALYARARDAGASVSQGPEDSPIAYSFTATDPDGNQWWVHAETGLLDQLRSSS